ncbi:unnamed protein product [Orchesella dallaii]|uniref:Uncharacterized protein n=1 Tax=Orchesella dallaii TaxID=48710 RepID=A0ABP1S3M2_9HEXA
MKMYKLIVNFVIPAFMRPLQAPFLGRKPKQNADLNGKRMGGSMNSGYRPRPIRPIIPKTYRGKIVMF